MKNNNEIIINGANPSIIWTQYMDFLSEYGKYMKSTYTKRMRANKPLTWEELDMVNQKIRQQLDFLMSWDEKFKNDQIMMDQTLMSQRNRTVYQSVWQLTKKDMGLLQMEMKQTSCQKQFKERIRFVYQNLNCVRLL